MYVYEAAGRLLTGHPSGIRQWADHTCVRIVLCASGINSLLVLSRANVVLSGAQDGQIQQWDCSGRNLLPVKLKEKPKVPKADSSKPAPRIPPITSLAARTDHTIVPEVFFGTKSLCIWRMKQEETAAPTVLLPGHAAAVQMVAFHPTQSSVFATVGDDGNVVVWDGQTHTARGWIRMGRQAAAHCLAFSSDGEHLAVGLSDGRLRVFEMPADQPQPTFSSGGNMELGTDDYPLVFGASVSKGALSDLKYSPDNRYLAVAYMMAVDIFAVGRDHTGVTYTPLSKCTGHSSVVKHVDFSTDGRLLRTNSQGYEILHYDARTGAQVVGDHRDQSWHTWSCVLGFPGE
jgi:WD40 repeat protein